MNFVFKFIDERFFFGNYCSLKFDLLFFLSFDPLLTGVHFVPEKVIHT